jgi:hypothetical protein
VSGENFVVPDEPVQVIHDPAKGRDSPRRLRVIPPVSLKFVDDVELFPPGAARDAVVEVTAARDNVQRHTAAGGSAGLAGDTAQRSLFPSASQAGARG